MCQMFHISSIKTGSSSMGSKDLLSAHDVAWVAAVETELLLLVLESETST